MERYTAKIHFERLNETTDEIKRYIKRLKKTKKISSILNLDHTWGRRFLSQRSKFLRSLIVRNVCEMLNRNKDIWLDHIDIVASVELFNVSTYQSDEVFDSNYPFLYLKNNSISNEILDFEAVISSYITFTLALDLISVSKTKEPNKQEFLNQMISSCQKVYEGQHADLFLLKKTHEQNPLEFSENTFLDMYLKRCKYLDGYQFAMCFLFGLILGAPESKKYINLKSHLIKIGTNFGMCLQILNDMENLSHVNERNFLEDVLNKKISYPIYLLWHQSIEGRYFIENVWKSKQELDTDLYRKEINRIFSNNPDIIRKLIELLWKYYYEIELEVKKLQKKGAKDLFLLDFIFPHIFLSRILRSFLPSSNSLHKILKKTKNRYKEELNPNERHN